MYLDPQVCFVPLGVDLRGGAVAAVQGGDEEAAVRGVPHHRHQAGTGAQEAAPQCQQSAQIPGTLHPSQNKLLQAPAPAEIPSTVHFTLLKINSFRHQLQLRYRYQVPYT